MRNGMRTIILVFSCFFFLNSSHAQEKEAKFEALKGQYLGQKPPGMVPEIFAPGIISTDSSEGCSVFFKSGTVFIFKQSSSRENLKDIFITAITNGTWTKPEPAPFDTEYSDGDFTLAPDEKTLYISSRRPLVEGGRALTESNIWVTEIIEGEWSEPRLLESTVNTEHHESYPAVTKDGTLYFFSRRPGGLGKSDLYRSRLINGKYAEAENLGPGINTGEHEWDPYIAADESFLIFCSTKSSGFGEDDFYVTFRNQDGSWTEPVNMGEDFNSSASENRPFITPDGKYFFFTSTKSGNRDVYWVDAKIIEALIPKELK
jgi:hypothetical protein